MIGRVKELNQLERLYNSTKFEFLTIYGRWRKTPYCVAGGEIIWKSLSTGMKMRILF